MFTYTHKRLLEILKNLFTTNFSVHQYNTRQACNTRQAALINVLKCHISDSFKSVSFKGIIMWNYELNKF